MIKTLTIHIFFKYYNVYIQPLLFAEIVHITHKSQKNVHYIGFFLLF